MERACSLDQLASHMFIFCPGTSEAKCVAGLECVNIFHAGNERSREQVHITPANTNDSFNKLKVGCVYENMVCILSKQLNFGLFPDGL